MRYINFLGISFCLLLNFFALYPSESENSQETTHEATLKSFCFDRPGSKQEEENRRNSLHRGLLNNWFSDQLIRDIFYRCWANPKNNPGIIKSLYPYLKPPFRNDFLSTIERKPVPISKLVPIKTNRLHNMLVACGSQTYPDETLLPTLFVIMSILDEQTKPPKLKTETLTNVDTYRDKDGDFTLSKFEKLTKKCSARGPLPYWPGDPWNNPVAWICMSPFNSTEKLMAVKSLLTKVDQEAVRDALYTCRKNKEYNSRIIDALEQKLAQKSSDQESSE